MSAPTRATGTASALRLAFTGLYVRDLPATLAFYRDASDLQTRFVHRSGQYAELDTGAETLAFTEDELSTTALADLPRGHHPNRPDQQPPGLDLAFATDDLDTAWDRAIAAGTRVVTPIVLKPWEQPIGYLRDLNGVLVEIGTPLDDHGDTPASTSAQ